MGNITLDDRDRAVLERLCQGDADVETLAAAASCGAADLRERLPELADNGLVEQTDGGYAVTDSGRRAILASPAGTRDNRIDTPPDVEERIESLDLRTDGEAAVRTAFTFLQYWGEAFGGEIVDAVYSENPAGFESREAWWEWVREHLEALPSVEPPRSTDRQWRYSGTPIVEKHTDDGRLVLEGSASSRSSARFALEHRDLDAGERTAVGAAFDLLVREGELTADEIENRAYPDHDAGYESASEWWNDLVRPALESLPGVEQSDGADVLAYRQTDEGPMSTDPGAETPDEPLGPEGGNDG